MSDNYILFTDSGADIPPSLLSEWGVGYQPLTFRFDHIDKEFSNDEMDIREFYRLMREGHIAKTSAVASAIFKDTFEAILAEGKDILYLAFSSGLSATCNNGRVAAEDAVAKFPDRKIIVVDSLVMDTEYVETTVASDNYKAGFVCGEDMKKILPEGSEVAIIAIPTAENCVKRVDGFKAAVGDYFKLVGNEPDGKGDTGTALPLAEDLLQGNPKLAGFFCANDPMAIACVQAVEAAKRTGEVAIYGVDGAPEAKAAIAAGKMTGTGAQSPTNIGRQSVDAAYTVLSGGTVDKDIAVETFLINADNVEKYGTDAWQ